jgi:hypothetical protein
LKVSDRPHAGAFRRRRVERYFRERGAKHSMVTLDVLADFLNFSFGGKPYEQQVRATWPDSDRLVSVR